ncbi:MAG: 4-(cytidine 5'-diphospho)-2-C-methyl-D-erythritol kinase [Luteolibacter sp.]
MSITHCIQASAKLNLSLRVLGKRDDGFHEIESLMVRLPTLADELEFSEAAEFSFFCNDPSVPGDEGNLVIKAVRAYEVAAKIECRFVIHLKKIIPHGAGLGGGSSDAAATLLALNQMHDGKLGSGRLIELAAGIGSDVPFFLGDSAALVSGRGERIESVEAPPALPILLLKPSFGVPTPEAYRHWADSQEIPSIRYAPQNIDGLELVNDLERPVFAKHRFLAELKQWLLKRDEVRAALLCGSGSTIFAVLRDGADAEQLARSARHELDPGLWHWAGMSAGKLAE